MLLILAASLSDEQKDLIEDLFNKNRNLFLQIANTILGSHEAAEDAVSDAMVKVITNIEYIRSISGKNLLAYCITIIKNTAYNFQRHEKFIISHDEMAFESQTSASAEDVVLLQIRDDDLVSMIDKLPRIERLIVYGRYFKNLSYPAIADTLSITEENARKLCQRGLEKLRNLMEGDD